MNSMSGNPIARNVERSGMTDSELKAENPLDLIWAVLEAANDLGDETTVEVCRRVIYASLYRTPASPADLHIICNYFR